MTHNRDRQGLGSQPPSPSPDHEPAVCQTMERLAVLDPRARRLLELVAVLDGAADPATWEAISGGPAPTRRLVSELRGAGLLADDNPFRCADPAVTSAVRSNLTKTDEDELLRWALATAIDAGAPPEVLVPLAATCPPAGDPVVVDLLAAAAQRHIRANEPARALVLLRRALDEPPTPARANDLRAKLALASLLDGETAATVLVLRAALHLEPLAGAQLIRRACVILATQGRVRDATGLAEKVARHFTSADPEVQSIIQLGWLTAAKLDLSLRPAVHRYLSDVSPERLDTSPSGRSLAGVTAYELSLIGEDRDRTVQLARRALDLRGGGSLTIDMPSIWNAVLALLFADELDDAAIALDRLERRGTERGRDPDVFAAHHLRVAVDRHRGRLDSANRSARLVSDALRRGWPGLAPGAAAERCRLALLAGHLDRAEAELALEGGVERYADNPSLVGYLDARGLVRYRQGRYAEALEDHLCVRDRHEALGAVNPATILWSDGAARALAALGRRTEALDLLDEQLDRARTWGAPRTIGALLTTAGTLRADRTGQDLVEEAVRLLEGGVTPIGLTEAHLALARLAQRRGDLRKAERSARRGAQIAEGTGALGLAAEARSILAEMDAPDLGPGALNRLTPAELRTARLAAGGATNAEIAIELYVSRKAVEYHLSNVYRKLGVTGRRHLSAALHGDDSAGCAG
jgi:DNA-binding CsgD family transcriptional regulator